MLRLVPEGHVESTVPTELGPAPTHLLVLVQVLPGQLQLTEETGLQTLGTDVRLGQDIPDGCMHTFGRLLNFSLHVFVISYV